jgi:hypothetical protein
LIGYSGFDAEKTKARSSFFGEKTRAFGAVVLGAMSAGLLCPRRTALSSPFVRRRAMSGIGESYRLYCCPACGTLVKICRRCDRGNLYCAGSCARERRRASMNRAGERYQSTRQGALHHAARQSRWRRRRREKVTHHGSGDSLGATTVEAPVAEEPIADVAAVEVPCSAPAPDPARLESPKRPAVCVDNRRIFRCSFCRRVLPVFARLGYLRGGP